MALTSSSTYAQIVAAYKDNADYVTAGGTSGVAKAKDFIQACRFLLLDRPVMESAKSSTLNYESIQGQLDKAEAWIQGQPDFNAADADNETTYANLEEYR